MTILEVSGESKPPEKPKRPKDSSSSGFPVRVSREPPERASAVGKVGRPISQSSQDPVSSTGHTFRRKGFLKNLFRCGDVMRETLAETMDDIPGGAELVSKKSALPFLDPRDKALGFKGGTKKACSFEEEWRVDGRVAACQTTEILETKDQARASVEKSLKALEGKTDYESNVRRGALEKMLPPLERAQPFLHATALREMVKQKSSEDRKEDRLNFFCAELPDMVRDSVIEAKTGAVFSILRAGALSDHLNSSVSLQLLDRAVRGDRAAIDQIRQIREQLVQRLVYKKLTEPQKAILQHMIEQLNVGRLKATSIERREVLRQQALSLIALHVKEGGERLCGKDEFHVAHTSLLYPGHDKWDSSGIAHVELRMIEDMQQIFSEIGNKKIFLDKDLKAPYVDAEGFVHIPRPEGVDKEKINLIVHYTNISPTHGLTSQEAKGQQELARPTIEMMREKITRIKEELRQKRALPQDLFSEEQKIRRGLPLKRADLVVGRAERLLNEVENDLNGTTTFRTAANLIEVEKILGWRVSTGCYSNKDRGGFVGRVLLTNLLTHNLEENEGSRRTVDVLSRENVYGAFSSDSNQMRFVRYVSSGKQHFLKVLPDAKDAVKIAKLYASRFLKAKMEKVSQLVPGRRLRKWSVEVKDAVVRGLLGRGRMGRSDPS